MDTTSLLLFLAVSQAVAASYYYHDTPHQQCAVRGEARFGFPVVVGNITSDTITLGPSGLGHSRLFSNVLYFVNDQPGDNTVYVLNAYNANIIGSINIINVTNVDWEDVTVGHCPAGITGSCIYVQDASPPPGNASANVIYIIREDDYPARDVSKVADKIIHFQTRNGTELRRSNGLFVDCQGNIFFFDTSPGGLGARLFQLKDIGGQYIADVMFQVDLPTSDSGPVALSMSPDCCELLIKFEDKVYYIPIVNGQFQTNRLQVLPYIPNDEEEAIAWGIGQDRYYVVSESEPHTLKVATRNRDVPIPAFVIDYFERAKELASIQTVQLLSETRFGLGSAVGTIENNRRENLVGLAASRNRLGFLYAVSSSRIDEILILQMFQTQTTGVIQLDVGNNTTGSVFDIATGSCPTSVNGSNCIYMQISDNSSNVIYVVREPENLFGVTTEVSVEANSLTFNVTGISWSVFIGNNGEIYIIDFVQPGETVTVFQLKSDSGSFTPTPIATFTNPSIRPGPVAADFSICSNELLVKFEDIVLLYDVKHKDVAIAFSSQPSYLPYVPEGNGHSIAFIGCNTYVTTSANARRVPLTAYSRIRNQSSKYVFPY